MKSLHAVALASAAFLLLGLSVGHAQDTDDSSSSGALQRRVAELESTVGLVKQKNADLVRDLDQVVKYLHAQAEEAQRLSSKLDESESLGFTAGINPRSRVVLLNALRALGEAKQSGLPKAKPATPAR